MRRGDLSVRSWASRRRVSLSRLSSDLSMSGGGLFSSLLGGILARCSWTIVVCMIFIFCLMESSFVIVGGVSMLVV